MTTNLEEELGTWRILIGAAGAAFHGFVGTQAEAIARFDKAARNNPRVILTLIATGPTGEIQVGGHTVDGELWGIVA
ncbi:MAG: hypothetical protein DWP92_00275 [Armatimonadetes bacterium]|nr:MAG: hypothetical protein DWP92_00275 [Armatimonadota bacterium]